MNYWELGRLVGNKGVSLSRSKNVSQHSKAVYWICLQGHLDSSWSEETGMALTNLVPSDQQPVSCLVGELPDQAALFGVLNRFYGLGYPLLSVTCLGATAFDEDWRRQDED